MKKKLFASAALVVAISILCSCSKKQEDSRNVVPAVNDGFVYVEGGTFTMGSKAKVISGYYSHPVHSATVSSFYASPYDVTQAEFKEVMGYNTSWYDDSEAAKRPVEGEDGTKRAVERMTWYEAVVYCNKLSIRKNLEPCYYMNLETASVNKMRKEKGLGAISASGKSKDGEYKVGNIAFTSEDGSVPEKVRVYDPDYWGKIPTDWSPKWAAIKWDRTCGGYRLFTEAEWEYAARGGKESKGYTSAGFDYGTDSAVDFAWYSKNSKEKVHQVGLKKPNELGLYDMVGNVFVWCWDWFDENYYTKESASKEDTEGPSGGDFKVVRGNTWDSTNAELGVEIRGSSSPYLPSRRVGMRLVRSRVGSSMELPQVMDDDVASNLQSIKENLRK